MSPPSGAAPELADVKALIAEHRGAIDGIKAAEGVSLTPEWDDYWLLRFALSFPDHDKAVEAVKRAVEYREEKKELLAMAAAGRPPPKHELIRKYCVADVHKCTDRGEPLYLIRAGLSNVKALLHVVSEDEVMDWMMYKKEILFRMCDAKTRESGHFVRMISVNDFRKLSILHGGFNKKFSKILGRVSHLSETVYPQLSEKNVMINTPRIFSYIFSVAKRLMSAKTLAKTAVCPGFAKGADATACPFLAGRMSMASLPTFLGGTCTCGASNACIGGHPNDQAAPDKEGDATEVANGEDNFDDMTAEQLAALDLGAEDDEDGKGTPRSKPT
eukprot:jgi/Mesvir1/27692/Mv07408-RA.1